MLLDLKRNQSGKRFTFNHFQFCSGFAREVFDINPEVVCDGQKRGHVAAVDGGDEGGGEWVCAEGDDAAEDQLEHAAGYEDRNCRGGPIEDDDAGTAAETQR